MTDERITAYLLEELTEQESEQFEEQCFAQDEWPDEIDSAEDDLIDAYLRNELTSDRRRRFEGRYLTTDARKARVLAAKTIHQVLCPAKPNSPGASGYRLSGNVLWCRRPRSQFSWWQSVSV